MVRKREETEVQNQIIQVAKTLGYLTYHTYDSRRCEPGFPDLWILGFGKLIVLELKVGKNIPTSEQAKWLEELQAAGVDARLYHVDTWKRGNRSIVTELTTAKRDHRRRHAK